MRARDKKTPDVLKWICPYCSDRAKQKMLGTQQLPRIISHLKSSHPLVYIKVFE